MPMDMKPMLLTNLMFPDVAARVPMFPHENIPYMLTDVPGITRSQHVNTML